MDLPGWQVIAEELAEDGLEVLSIACDSGGLDRAKPWIEAADPSYTVLIDEQHLVASLYNMRNVPTAVWIDEGGFIVRPNETAFVDDRFADFSGLESSEYLAALRDWARRGAESEFALPPAKVRQRWQQTSAREQYAHAQFRLAEILHELGHEATSIAHFREAQRLIPDSWNFKRQAWQRWGSEAFGTSFGEEVEKLGDRPYYPPLNLRADAAVDDER